MLWNSRLLLASGEPIKGGSVGLCLPHLRKAANLSHLLTGAVSQLLPQQPADIAMTTLKTAFLSHLSVSTTRRHLVTLVCSLLLFLLLFVTHSARNHRNWLWWDLHPFIFLRNLTLVGIWSVKTLQQGAMSSCPMWSTPTSTGPGSSRVREWQWSNSH